MKSRTSDNVFFMLQGSIKSFKEDEVTAAPILAWSSQDRLLLDK